MKTRREFIGAGAGAFAAFALGSRPVAAAGEGGTYPGWKPGEMDLHFIYTGRGENMFYRLPDGTAILNDVGEFYRPRELNRVPLLPSKEVLGGDWVRRYISRVYPEKTIDYAVFSHWHSDHVGHAEFDGDGVSERDPGAALRYRVTPDGRKINGFLCVAEEFSFRRYFDHQYPNWGAYESHDSSMALLAPWLEEQKKKGLVADRFRPGALDQIALLRDPAKYKGVFSIRNIAANGAMWDGANGVIDYAAEHVARTGRKKIYQNMLSMSFVIQYGAFRYFTGGDIQQDILLRADGTKVPYEALVGERAGRVNVCKMNHHGCSNAMTEGFVKAVNAQVYTAGMWCPYQAHPETLNRLTKTAAATGGKAPLFAVGLVSDIQTSKVDELGYKLPYTGPAHVVVKVFPGGNAYRVYALDAHDESMRILSTYDFVS